jgi:hypothetical protein
MQRRIKLQSAPAFEQFFKQELGCLHLDIIPAKAHRCAKEGSTVVSTV